MLTGDERSRLGELRGRMDLSPEERLEMDELNRRFLEQALGNINADFLLIEDSGGGRLIPHTAAAKRVFPGEVVPRDREQLSATLKHLEEQGLTIQRKRAA